LTFSVVAALAITLDFEAAAQPPPKSGGQAAPTTTAIRLEEVAARAAEALNLLPALTAQLAPSAAVDAIMAQLPEINEQIDLDMVRAVEVLRGQPSLALIATEQQSWEQRRQQTSRWLNLLTQRATQLQETLARLASLHATWSETGAAARAANAPGPLLQQVDSVLAAIEKMQTPFQAERVTVLDLQSRVAQEVARCGAALALFADAERSAVGAILTRDSPPIWSAELWAQAPVVLPARIHEVRTTRWKSLVRYVQGSTGGIPRHLGMFVVLTVLLCLARRQVRRWNAAGESMSPAAAVFDHPYAAALMIPLVYASAPTSGTSPWLRQLFEVLTLVPVIWLIRPVVDLHLVPELYMLLGVFAVDTVRQAFAGAPVLEQALLALEMLAGMAGLAYALTRGGLRRPSPPAPETNRLRGFRVTAVVVLLTLAVTLVAGALGHMRLARLLASGVLGGGVLALTLYAGVRVAVGVVAFALRVWPLRLLRMVQHHRDLLERRTHTALIWAAIGAWAVRWLDLVGLFQPVRSFVQAVLTAPLGRGAIQISVGDILEFVLTVGLAYVVSAFVRFVLREDVYPRTQLTRGISYAISSLLNYVIIALGFVLALGVLGVDLTRVTILASAFGVGIGFGLQSIVNNFVSGLVLLFEQPIHVGDIVEVGDLSGEVSRIGIRASTVRTWQGAEIIVPNAQLVTERVTNWTLSDRTRRIDLPVGVDYGSSPEKVVEVLEAVARAHPQIMQNPAPQAVFTAFGDSSINFELRAWTNRYERWPRIQTELAAALYAALHAAGMTIPFPQREVRVLHDASPAALGSPGSDADPPGRGAGSPAGS
jgi:small-conductance mechanosensitive channel